MKLLFSLILPTLLISMLTSCVESRHYRPIEEPPLIAPPAPTLRFPPNNSYRGSVMVSASGYESPPRDAADNVGQAYVYFGAAGNTLNAIEDGTMNGTAKDDEFGRVATDDTRARMLFE